MLASGKKVCTEEEKKYVVYVRERESEARPGFFSRLLQRHVRIQPVHVEQLLAEPGVAHAVHAGHEGVDALEVHGHGGVVWHRVWGDGR